jgi:uncharacterized membrane protein (DUF4010 family)
MIAPNLSHALGILISALGGAAVGLEREWSGHARGPKARFAGIRGGRARIPVTGMLGGLISSTNVTLSFARMSRVEDSARIPLAYGVIGASAVMFVRVGIATAVLNPAAAQTLALYLIVPFLVAACIAAWGMWKYRERCSAEPPVANPLQLWTAVQMALLFQVVLFAVRWAQGIWGQAGIFVSAGVLGFADVDALVISMAKNTGAQVSTEIVARAIAVGVLTNTVLKFLVGVFLGAKKFRWIAGMGLAAVALALSLVVLPPLVFVCSLPTFL